MKTVKKYLLVQNRTVLHRFTTRELLNKFLSECYTPQEWQNSDVEIAVREVPKDVLCFSYTKQGESQ